MSRYDTDAIRREVPIDQIIGQAVALKKKGKELKGLCPFHGDTNPSFAVIPHKQFAVCNSCHWSGDVIKFVMDYQNVDFITAARMLVGDKTELDQSPEAKAERQALVDQRKKREEAERREAIGKARRIWETAEPADPHHGYLMTKQVPPHCLRQTSDGWLVIPVYDAEGEIQSIQRINESGDKLFMAGAPMSHGRMMIGINMGRTILCEGFATGASIFDAIPDQVCVTFSMDNMEKIAREMAASGRSVILAADTKTSAERMTKLGAELGFPVVAPRPGMVMPPNKDGEIKDGSDFNDQMILDGVSSVTEWFRAALREYAERAVRIEEASKEDTGPFDLWASYQPPALPRGLLPPVIDRFAFESAEQMGTDPAGFAMSALAACATAIKDPICVKAKQHEDWTESARIWVMLIGKPSARKSPMMKRATRAIKKLDVSIFREGQKALADWQEDGGSKSGSPKPPVTRLRIEDVTTESAQEACKDSPNGLMALYDELQGLFGRIEKYGGSGKASGGDRSFWLQAYGGGQYAVNRIGRGSFLIDNLSITILGGIQPDTIRRIMHDSTDDGLIQRFIPIILQPAGIDRDIEVPPVADEFNGLVERLFNLEPPTTFFGEQPLKLSEGARKVREDMVQRHHAMGTHLEDFNTRLSTHIGKYDGLFPRLCVVWHCIEHVDNPDGLPMEISKETALRVATFMTDYVVPHAVAFYTSTIGLSDGQDEAREIGGFILAHKKDTITLRDIDRGIRSLRSMKPEDQMRVMEHLEAFGWLERDDKRRDAPSWKVNPQIHEMFAEKAQNERERRAQVRATINEIIKADKS